MSPIYRALSMYEDTRKCTLDSKFSWHYQGVAGAGSVSRPPTTGPTAVLESHAIFLTSACYLLSLVCQLILSNLIFSDVVKLVHW